jgi:small GTP-binding protein
MKKKGSNTGMDCVYKVLLLGDSTVGKTCILLKYTDKIFQETHMMTIGLDYRLKTMTLQSGKEVKLQIWDTAGQDRFRSITKNYYKGSHGIILIYDVTSLKTFENVKSWVSQIHEEISDKVVIYLVGNKIDMDDERKVKTEEGQKLAEELGVPFVETSAKSGENIDKIFSDITERIDKEFGNIQKVRKNISYQAPGRKCC